MTPHSPRNPFVRDARTGLLRSGAGPHRCGSGAQRQAQARALKRELHALAAGRHRPSDGP